MCLNSNVMSISHVLGVHQSGTLRTLVWNFCKDAAFAAQHGVEASRPKEGRLTRCHKAKLGGGQVHCIIALHIFPRADPDAVPLCPAMLLHTGYRRALQ